MFLLFGIFKQLFFKIFLFFVIIFSTLYVNICMLVPLYLFRVEQSLNSDLIQSTENVRKQNFQIQSIAKTSAHFELTIGKT